MGDEKAVKTPETYFEYMKFTMPISFNALIDFVPLTIAFIFLGLNNNLVAQSVVGFGMTYIIFMFGYVPSIQEVVGLKCASPYDQKRFDVFTINIFKLFGCVMIYALVSLVFIIFVHPILLFIKIEPEFAIRVSWFIIFLSFAKFVEIGLTFLKSTLVIQKKSDCIWYLNLYSIFSLLVFNFLFILVIPLQEYGFVMAITMKILGETGISAYFVVTKSNPEIMFIPEMNKILEGFMEMLKFSVHVLIGGYGEWTAIEVNTYFSALTKKTVNIVTWSFMMNICSLHYLIGYGEIAFLRTFGANAIGKRDKKEYQEIWRRAVTYGLANHLGISVLTFIFSSQLTFLFTTDEVAAPLFHHLVKILSLLFVFEFILPLVNTSLRLVGREALQFYIMSFIFPVLMVSSSSLLCFTLGLENFGLLYSFFISDIVVDLLMLFFYVRTFASYAFDRTDSPTFLEQEFFTKEVRNKSQLSVQ